MSNETRNTQSRFLPPFLAAVCGFALAAPTLGQDSSPFATGGVDDVDMNVQVSEHLTVDLHVQDEELANVLQILSLQSQKNILVSGDVSATVNANLYNVTFYEALESILNVNGYGYVEKGSFIYVYTLEEIAELEQAARQPVTRVIRLNYLNANDAAEFVAPLLSEVGSIKSNGDVDSFSIPDGSPVGDETFALSATLVIFDYPEHIDEIERLIVDLDTRPSQVLVEATILETSLREMNGFGIDFSFISDLEFTDFIDLGGPLGATQGIINGGDGTSGGLTPADSSAFSSTSTAGNTASGPATFKLGVIDDNISFFLRALDDITDVTVLSRPKVMALNRQPARVLVGRRIGYLSTTSTETSTTQTVEFLDTGTQLKFRAFVGNDGFIRMELHPSTSTGETRDASGASGAAVTIPEEVTQEITTNVLVRDGSTVVLGGLFRESTTLSRRQVPILGDIPLLGAAFRGHDDDTRRSEIIFMITPTIVNDQILTQSGDLATDYVENVRTGTRAGLLPWSRDRQSAELNVSAEKAALNGDPAKGLFLIRRSLELNPNQPDAIRLRERLLQQQSSFPSRSVVQDIFDEELNDRMSAIEPLEVYKARLAAERLEAERLADVKEIDEVGSATTSFDNAGFDDEFISDEVIVAGPSPDGATELTLSLPPDQAQFFTDPSGIESSEATVEVDDEFSELDPPAADAFPGDRADAGDVFDTLIEETSANGVTRGTTTSPAISRARDELSNLRLTVTVAPSDDEIVEPSRTSVTLTPEASYSDSYPEPTPRFDERIQGLESAVSNTASDFDSGFNDDFESGFGSEFSTPQTGEGEDGFTPSRYTGSTLAGLEAANDADTAPRFGGTTTGLIGPAFAGETATLGGASTPVMGGFWVWFRDSVVLDKGEVDTEAAIADADSDDDEN